MITGPRTGTDGAAPRPSWSRHLTPFHWREAALCAPAMPLLVIAGVLAGRPVQGVVAAGAAFLVGFGAARELRGRRWSAMIAACLGMAAAAFAGCLTGGVLPLHAGLAALLAAGCAALALRDEAMWWAALQTVITFLVAGYYSGGVEAAGLRTAAVLAGGGVQIAIVACLARVFPAAAAPFMRGLPPHSPDPARAGSHMVRAALSVGLCVVVATRLGLANSYWAPMTAIIVLKPHLLDVRTRGIARLMGTLLGCIGAALYADACHDQWWAMLAALVATGAAAYALQRAHYAALTACITATVVLLLALGGADVVTTDEHRVIATVLGGVVAIVIALIVPHPLDRGFRRRRRTSDGG